MSLAVLDNALSHPLLQFCIIALQHALLQFCTNALTHTQHQLGGNTQADPLLQFCTHALTHTLMYVVINYFTETLPASVLH
jgi:hypothetical protein